MALDAMDLLLKFPEALRDARIFERATKTAHWVEDWHDRRKAAKTPGVIVSPDGMLKGGASVLYMENIAGRRANAILMVSVHVRVRLGRILLRRRNFVSHARARPVEAQI